MDKKLEMTEEGLLVYRPDGKVLTAFLRSKAPVKIIQGPVGSGKTLGALMDISECMREQRPSPRDGKRRSRILVVRETYPKLKETTINSWLEWFPEDVFGKFRWQPPFRHIIRIADIEAEVTFVGLEDEKQIAFFRSYEPTMVYFNELQYTARALFDEAVSRVGRYPRVLDGGAVNPRVIADMNAPDETHWVPMMRGDVAIPEYMTEDERAALVKPDDWEFYTQPAGLLEVIEPNGRMHYVDNPEAENTLWLPDGYYHRIAAGKTKSWIDANIMNRVSARRGGRAVHQDFKREVHVAKQVIEPIPGVDLVVGIDFGRSPAAIFCQELRGRWYALRELIGRDIGSARFAELLRLVLAQHFAGLRYRLYGDPSGDFKGQNDELTPFIIFRQKGLPIQPAPSNLLTIRLQAVDAVLSRMHEGLPCLVISPRCQMLIAGMDGGYHYRRLMVAGERYADQPEKDEYSHPCDGLQYALLGGGEGRVLLAGSPDRPAPVQTRKEFHPHRRLRRRRHK